MLNHVQLRGALDDDEVIRLYQACDVIVLPALVSTDDTEGFGIVLLEAAAAGKPAVAMRVGGIPDAVEDGKSGILVAPRARSLSQTLIDLLSNETARSTGGVCYLHREESKKLFPGIGSWLSTKRRLSFESGFVVKPRRHISVQKIPPDASRALPKSEQRYLSERGFAVGSARPRQGFLGCLARRDTWVDLSRDLAWFQPKLQRGARDRPRYIGLLGEAVPPLRRVAVANHCQVEAVYESQELAREANT